MNIEEKAKAYDEALERARALRNEAIEKEYVVDYIKDYETIFPELRESDDERIRKEIISALKFANDGGVYDKHIAYLEKQKEQKPAEWSEEDKRDMAHIIRILDDCYGYGRHDLSKTDHENLVNKLKSLRPSWKPSEEQIMKVAVEFKCIGKKVKMTVQELINYYIDAECCEVADECGF